MLNPQFDKTLTGWEVRTEDGSTASMSIVNTGELSGPNAGKVSITEDSGTDWHIQLIHTGPSVQSGSLYTISFDAKASAPKNVGVEVRELNNFWDNFGGEYLMLTTTPQSFSFDIIPVSYTHLTLPTICSV